MRLRALIPIVLTSLLAGTVAHARATFDPTTGTLRLPTDSDVVVRYDFEDPTGLGDVLLSRSGGKLTPLTESVATDVLTTGPDDAIEGERALRISGGTLVMIDAKMFASSIASRKFEISFWAREDGANALGLLYYNANTPSATAVATGRRTSDGWAEFVFGPIDGRTWGLEPAGIMLFPGLDLQSSAPKSASILIDAIEIRTVEGAPMDPKTCTQANVTDVCGADGACVYGHCLSSAFEAGPLPNEAQRRAFVERWIFFMTSILGDRKASVIAKAQFAPKARELAKSAVSSTQFYGGLRELVNQLRDAHTTFAATAGGSDVARLVQNKDSSILGACFGVVEKDLLGGGLGYGVFAANEKPLTGVVLQRGDVLTAIDGQDPKKWVDTYWPRFGFYLPNDPAADWGASALDLAGLVSTRASTLTFTRCASATDCTGASRKDFTVDIGTLAYDAIVKGTAMLDANGIVPGAKACSPRLVEAVPHNGVGTDENVYVATTETGETRIQFDGFGSSSAWVKGFTDAFSSRPSHVLVDARLGHGGAHGSVQALLNLLRDKDDPVVLLMAGRRAYDFLDPPWSIENVAKCSSADVDSTLGYDCTMLRMDVPSTANPTGASSRIAWVNTVDVSANDLLPRLLRGRKDFRIFAPHPTQGAFGSILALPALSPAFLYGGSVQVLDSKVGVDVQSAIASTWESGVGVAPDTLVTQKLSDALAGIDTLLEAANQWLKTP